MPRRRFIATGVAVAAVAGAALVAPASGQELGRTVVAGQLNNPRGVSFGPDGALYVAEAGRTGRTCLRNIGCIGYTSGVARISGADVTRVATGIFSGGAPDGTFAGGATDVAFDSVNRPVVITNGVPPSGRVPRRARRQGSRLARVGRNTFTALARLDTIELTRNPDRQDRNPNPYGVERLGNEYYVIDAGGNDVLRVDGTTRRVTVEAVIPNPARRVQPVPTAIATGPDGALYIAELAPGRNVGQVIRLVPGGDPTVVARGIPSATGIALTADGTIYLSLFNTGGEEEPDPNTGRVMRIAPDGTQSIVATRLNFPAGMAIGADGDLYVANNSILPGRAARRGPFRGKTGEVVKVDLP